MGEVTLKPVKVEVLFHRIFREPEKMLTNSTSKENKLRWQGPTAVDNKHQISQKSTIKLSNLRHFRIFKVSQSISNLQPAKKNLL